MEGAICADLFPPQTPSMPASMDLEFLNFLAKPSLGEGTHSLANQTSCGQFNSGFGLDLAVETESFPPTLTSFALPPPATADAAFFEIADQQDLNFADLDFDLICSPSQSLVSVPDVDDCKTPTEGAGGPIRRRRPKVPVPEDIKNTAKYQERRRKNNAAAARNREMKRNLAQETKSILPELSQQNIDLRAECVALRVEMEFLLAALRARLQ